MLCDRFTRRQVLQALAAPPMALAVPPPQPALVFAHVAVIDGAGPVRRDQTVLVTGERIAAIADSGRIAVPRGARLIDGRGKFLIPGLWDMHAHLSYTKASALAVLLANGVTGIRDMGGLLSELDAWRTKIDRGLRPGPRIVRAGPIVNGKKFNEFQIVVNDAGEARGAVRALQHVGVDFIKVHAAISREAYLAVSQECELLRIPFAGHIPRAVMPEEVSDRGQATVEHVGAFADRLEMSGTLSARWRRPWRRFVKRKRRLCSPASPGIETGLRRP